MSSTSNRRVVVTGIGVVSNVGADAPTFWQSLLAGRCGLDRITSFEQDDQWVVRIAGECRDWNAQTYIDGRELKRMDRFAAMGLHAACEAVADCGFDFSSGDPHRHGVAIGSGVGGIETIEDGQIRLTDSGPRKISPFIVPKLMVNACAGNVSIRFDLRGANTATSTACATGAHAIGHAMDLIRLGRAEVMVAGGAEAAVTPLCIAAFSAMKALSRRNDAPAIASRPFDRDRDGFVLAEGAAILVLEELEHARARGATVYAELTGWGLSGDAQHIAAPDPDGNGAAHAMKGAVADAGITPEDIGYINAHGTSTPLGDAAEVVAVKRFFGDHAAKLAISSTKSMTGHTLGAAGGLETVASVLAVRDGVCPPTINLDHPDEGFDLDFVAHEPQQRPIKAALNNSFGFGGHNVSLCIGRFDG